MVATRSKRLSATTDSIATTEPPSKRVKSSPPSPPSTSTSSNKPQKKKTPVKSATKPSARVVVPQKRAPKKQEEAPESEDSIKLRKKNIGKKFSPGDGQLDYTLSELILLIYPWSTLMELFEPTAEPEPFRNPQTLEFLFPDYPRFKPNMSPSEILKQGSFDGGYFKPVKSKKSGRELHEDWADLPREWIEGLDESMYLTRPEGAEDSVNKWQPRMGQGYEAWESNGWIMEQHDARGWFQWYYRFFRGRRCEDDERQVGRWDRVAGEASGRWRRIYLEKYRKRGVHFIEPNEEEVSPGIRQTLNHWAFDPTSDSLNRFREEKGDLVADEDADEGDDSE